MLLSEHMLIETCHSLDSGLHTPNYTRLTYNSADLAVLFCLHDVVLRRVRSYLLIIKSLFPLAEYTEEQEFSERLCDFPSI